MGLDQYAGTFTEPLDTKFQWRKHAKLQKYFEEIWYERNTHEFNCEYLILRKSDVVELKRLVEKDPMPKSEGGFFYGHEFQEESAEKYKQQDLDFCNWAIEQIDNGNEVAYRCWY